MSKKILIAEDEPDIALVFKKQLQLSGDYEVDIATDGQKALDKMRTEQFDLVFLDLVMPDMDGLEVMKELKENADKYKKAPIIALTNVTSQETRDEVASYGVVEDFVVKTDTDIDVVVKKFFGK